MFGIESDDIYKLERDLTKFKKRALPFATKKTLNDAAFAQQKIIRADLNDKFILRNAYTRQSIRVDRAQTLRVARQEAITGSTAEYMEDQEFGGLKRKSGKHGVAIPTSYAAGQSMKLKPRTRRISKKHRLSSIRLSSRKYANKKQEIVLKVRHAVQSGQKYFYHDFGNKKKKGIFKVIGGSKRSKRGWPGRAKIRMVYDLSETSVDIPKEPSFYPSQREVVRMLPALYVDALRFQLRRYKILGY